MDGVSTWIGGRIRIPRVVRTLFFFLFFPLLFPKRYYELQNGHPCIMSFLLFINFLFLIWPWPYLCVFICISVQINSGTRRSNSPQFSRLFIFQPHLITASIIRKFIHLVNFVTFMISVFFFFFGNRVWLNLYERALSVNELFS